MNVLEVLTALVAGFTFLYLLWALLRAEDF